MEKKLRGGFTGNLGFILAAAGSAVGLGNLWRFPYLAAKDGGGLFILVYIILSLTAGFALMLTEIAIGRKTGLNPLQAYGVVHSKFKFLGVLATAIPLIIFPYYCVIGGWVTKYAASYITGGATTIYEKGAGSFFNGFITGEIEPLIWFFVFMAVTAVIVLLGVEKGIEKASKIIMPLLIFLILGIVIYSLTLKYTDANGVTRTAWEGVKIYLVPNFEGITVSKFFSILLDAFGQMFYSLSIAMGILITYGSYCKKDANLVTSVHRIELFDTGIALLAGLIIIPSVFVFQGTEGLSQSGPGLMFVSLPAIFEQMGAIGHVVGALFFVLVFFAALTSSISLMETVASTIIDRFHVTRKIATIITFVISLTVGAIVCLGYSIFYMEISLPNGTTGQILDILDYASNSVLMPIVALITCLLIGWFAKPGAVMEEVEIGLDGKPFRQRRLFVATVKFVAPVLLVIILLQAFNLFSFLG